MTYDYFDNVHNRSSVDGNGASIGVIANYYFTGYINPTDNARWYSPTRELQLGRGGGSSASDDLVSLDVVGHEFTHGVDQFSANLEYSYESGALDESFADIHGTMFEFYGECSSGNYLR